MSKTLIACFSHAGQNYSHGGIRNLAVGNTAEQLFTLVQSNLPFIGYPRTLNAIAAINAALPKDE